VTGLPAATGEQRADAGEDAGAKGDLAGWGAPPGTAITAVDDTSVAACEVDAGPTGIADNVGDLAGWRALREPTVGVPFGDDEGGDSATLREEESVRTCACECGCAVL
jgi:hypothetical protein